MQQNVIQRSTFLIAIFFVFCIAWYLQSQILINVDVSWLLEASKRMLAGGTYTKDYFENNPPWILYFYAPAVFLAKVSNMTFSIRLYVFALSSISLFFSYYFFKQLFSKEDSKLTRLLTIMLAILFLIFPADDFAQREHVFFILSIPYFLMIVVRLQGGKVNPYLAFFIGLFSGSGFIIKPYFLAPLVFVELYLLCQSLPKTCRGWYGTRPEIYAITTLLIIYAAILFLRHPDYIHVVMPYALRWCYVGTKKPWSLVINNQWTEFCFLTLLLYFATYEINRYKQFTFILLLAFAGFFASYVMQQEDWPYHLKPAFAMALFLDVIFLYFYIVESNMKRYISILMYVFVFLLIILFDLKSAYLNYNLITHPFIFFGLMTGIFVFVSYQVSQKIKGKFIQYLVSISGSLIVGYLFCYVVAHFFVWNNLLFISTVLVLLLSFAIFIPGSLKDKKLCAFVTLFSLFLFLLPYYVTYLGFNSFKEIKMKYAKLGTYLNQNAAGKTVYFFVTNVATYPVISSCKNVTSSSRFSFFWALPGLIKQPYMSENKAVNEALIHDKNYLINMISEDLNSKSPEFVFIDMMDKKSSIHIIDHKKNGFVYLPFDYLSYFGSNQNFNKAWENYRYLTTISENKNEYINPLKYKIKLTYQSVPNDNLIENGMVYIYIANDGNVEVALKNDDSEVNRIKMHSEDVSALKKNLSESGTLLDNRNKKLFMSWLSRQIFSYPLYKFNIYKRISSL